MPKLYNFQSFQRILGRFSDQKCQNSKIFGSKNTKIPILKNQAQKSPFLDQKMSKISDFRVEKSRKSLFSGQKMLKKAQNPSFLAQFFGIFLQKLEISKMCLKQKTRKRENGEYICLYIFNSPPLLLLLKLLQSETKHSSSSSSSCSRSSRRMSWPFLSLSLSLCLSVCVSLFYTLSNRERERDREKRRRHWSSIFRTEGCVLSDEQKQVTLEGMMVFATKLSAKFEF